VDYEDGYGGTVFGLLFLAVREGWNQGCGLERRASFVDDHPELDALSVPGKNLMPWVDVLVGK
jgi:hypothetical protein